MYCHGNPIELLMHFLCSPIDFLMHVHCNLIGFLCMSMGILLSFQSLSMVFLIIEVLMLARHSICKEFHGLPIELLMDLHSSPIEFLCVSIEILMNSMDYHGNESYLVSNAFE